MKSIRTLGMLMLFALTFSALHRTARADDWDKITTVTFSDSVQLPGTVLQPGTYVFKLTENLNRNIVQVFNQDQTRLITTVMAVRDYRVQPSGETIMRYAERPGDQPPALEAWFYPGDDFGQQFVYPKSESLQLSQVNNTQVPSAGSDQVATPEASTPAPDAASQNSPETSAPQAAPAEQNLTAQADTTPMGTATTPAPQSEPTTSTTPANAQTTDQNATLPKTASVMPLVGLVGLCLIATALVLRRKAHA